MTLNRERAGREKKLLAELRPQVASVGWRMSRSAVFRQHDNYFQYLFIDTHRNAPRTTVAARFKPMTLDPVLWRIMGIEGNESQPLSFRAWGAFTCDAPPLSAVDIETPTDSPQVIASRILEWLKTDAPDVVSILDGRTYSEWVQSHPWHVERGAFAITLVASLIDEGQFDAAREAAAAYASGKRTSTGSFTSNGKSFHELSLELLDRERRIASEPSEA